MSVAYVSLQFSSDLFESSWVILAISGHFYQIQKVGFQGRIYFKVS